MEYTDHHIHVLPFLIMNFSYVASTNPYMYFCRLYMRMCNHPHLQHMPTYLMHLETAVNMNDKRVSEQNQSIG